MAAADRTHLFASDRVSDEHGLLQLEGVDDGKNIVSETVGGVVLVVGGRVAGLTEAATGNAVDVILAGEFGRKVVVAVGGVAQAGEKDERAPGAAPVEDFELDAGLDRDELHGVW